MPTRRGLGPPDAEWWTHRRGSEVWRRFGKRMFAGVLLFFAFAATALLALGAIIAVAISGGSAAGIAAAPIIGLLVITLVVGLVMRAARRTWFPVRELIRSAGRLADGDYSARVATTGSRAVQPVVSSFNEMARRLEEADEQRRRLLADIGHELRTPLTVIRGEIEAMLDGVHRADPEELEQLLDEVGVMERLLADLRTLSLAEAGALALHPEPTDIADLVHDVVDGLDRRAEEAGVAVRLTAQADLGDIVVDPVRIREVVANLVVNALRAMPNGGVLAVEVRRVERQVVITVADTGVGIAPDDLDAVFERFHKGSTSSGSGLGLTISKDLVEAHGGAIAITSKPDEGTTVTVRLPLVPAA